MMNIHPYIRVRRERFKSPIGNKGETTDYTDWNNIGARQSFKLQYRSFGLQKDLMLFLTGFYHGLLFPLDPGFF